MAERLALPFGRRGVEHLSAFLDLPEGRPRESAVLLAHGAGHDADSPFMRAVGGGLSGRGFPVLRFQYPYRERAEREGKRMLPVDPREDLEAAHRLALEELRRRFPDRRAVLAGKSLGARISSTLAARGEDCRGLVFLGYPLHPPGRPDETRAEHFPALAHPALFLQGARDPFCELDRLEEALARYGGRATLELVEGADHGFEVRGMPHEEVLARLVERIDRWERETWPA